MDDGYRVTHYGLELDYRAPSNRLTGRARLSCVADRDLTRFTVDLAGMVVTGVALRVPGGGRFGGRGGRLLVRPRKPIPAGETFDVDVRYRGKPSRRPGAAWFPSNDRRDGRARYEVSATVDRGYALVACGDLLTRGRESGRRVEWFYRNEEPAAVHPSIHIGQYELVDLPGGDAQRVALPEGRGIPRALARQPRMVELFETLFGRYPLGSYTAVVYPQWLESPVEGHGITVFGADHLTGRAGEERLVSHALARQWFGSSLRAGAVADRWLTGGLARYAEWLWSAESGSAEVAALAGRARRGLTVSGPRGPEGDERLFDRGALAVHALHDALGGDRFFSLLRHWCDTDRCRTVTVAAFRARLEAAAPEMRHWPHDPNLPDLSPG